MRHEYGVQRRVGERSANLSIDKCLKLARHLLHRENPRGQTSSGMLDVEEWSALQRLVDFSESAKRGGGGGIN